MVIIIELTGAKLEQQRIADIGPENYLLLLEGKSK